MFLVRTAPWGRHGIAQNAFKNGESVCPYHASEPSVMWSGSAIESVSLSYTRASGSRLLPSRGFPRGVSGPFTALLFAPFRPHFPMPGTGGPTRGAKRHPLSQHSWRTVHRALHRGRGAPGKPRWKRVSAKEEGGRRSTRRASGKLTSLAGVTRASVIQEEPAPMTLGRTDCPRYALDG